MLHISNFDRNIARNKVQLERNKVFKIKYGCKRIIDLARKHWYKSGVDLGCGPPRRIPGPTSCWGPLEDIVPCPHTDFEPDPTRGQSTGLSTRFVSEWCEGGSRRTRAASGVSTSDTWSAWLCLLKTNPSDPLPQTYQWLHTAYQIQQRHTSIQQKHTSSVL